MMLIDWIKIFSYYFGLYFMDAKMASNDIYSLMLSRALKDMLR